MNIAWSLVAILASALFSAWWGDSRGYDRGVANAQATADRVTIDRLDATLASHSALIAQSTAASDAMRNQLALRETADEAHTDTLRKLLAPKRASRDPYRFDADSMLALQAARDRAAAAVAGGVRGALPTAGIPGQRSP